MDTEDLIRGKGRSEHGVDKIRSGLLPEKFGDEFSEKNYHILYWNIISSF